jgi:hypothetical protein
MALFTFFSSFVLAYRVLAWLGCGVAQWDVVWLVMVWDGMAYCMSSLSFQWRGHCGLCLLHCVVCFVSSCSVWSASELFSICIKELTYWCTKFFLCILICIVPYSLFEFVCVCDWKRLQLHFFCLCLLPSVRWLGISLCSRNKFPGNLHKQKFQMFECEVVEQHFFA